MWTASQLERKSKKQEQKDQETLIYQSGRGRIPQHTLGVLQGKIERAVQSDDDEVLLRVAFRANAGTSMERSHATGFLGRDIEIH
jgi:hypothetical protein